MSTAEVRCVFASPAHAEIAAATLSVDPELHPERVRRSIAAEGAGVSARFEAADGRSLRSAVGAYVDMLGVVLRTLREFG